MTSVRGRRKVRTGRVVGDKMDKTVVVAVERHVHHPLYGKSMRVVTNFKVHDEENHYKVGDLVSIVETRPISRTKTWRVLELLSQREAPETQPMQAIEEAVAEALAPVSVQEMEAEAPMAEAAMAEAPMAEAAMAEEHAPVAVAETPAVETPAEAEPEAEVPAVEEAAEEAEAAVVEETPVDQAPAEAEPEAQASAAEEEKKAEEGEGEKER